MDMLLIVREASASSLVGTMLRAMEERKGGREVGVLLTGEALWAAMNGYFAWPAQLAEPKMRLQMADVAKEKGWPLVGRGEGRQLDGKGLISQAAEAGVMVYACPVWSQLLGIDEGLPAPITPITIEESSTLLRVAGVVIGTL